MTEYPVADPRIAAALGRADELADRAPAEHVAIYEDVHETLQQVLTDAGETEAGETDAGETDAGRTDAGTTEEGGADPSGDAQT